jgi:LPXTG-motif cell wall-anchored protein
MGAGFYSGYMANIPANWQSALGGPVLIGNCCLSIISRTSYGPSVSSFNPESIGTANALVYYDQNHQTMGLYGASGVHPIFNGTTRISGLAFPAGSDSVLFFGSTGVGNYCYGEAAACGDPSNNSKGEHAYPYRMYAWAYNANDLAAVKAGTKQPWEVVPYATWELPLGDVHTGFSGSVGYDSATQKIYLAENCKDTNCKPVIQVFQINNLSGVAVAPSLPNAGRVSSNPWVIVIPAAILVALILFYMDRKKRPNHK